MGVVQTGPCMVSIDMFSMDAHQDLKTDIQIKGVYTTKVSYTSLLSDQLQNGGYIAKSHYCTTTEFAVVFNLPIFADGVSFGKLKNGNKTDFTTRAYTEKLDVP